MAIAALASACQGRSYGTDDLAAIGDEITPLAIDTSPKGEGAQKDDPVPSPTTSRRGTIVITVEDGRGLKRPFINVRLTSSSGRTTTTIETDFRGKARARVTPGTWRAEVLVGCQDKMWVTFGGHVTIGVPERTKVAHTLRAEATRRMMPGPPTRFPQPPWPLDEPTQLRFRFVDRCEGTLAPNQDFTEEIVVHPEGAIALALDARRGRSDADAWVTATVECMREGDAALWYRDRFNRRDRVDVLSFTPPVDPTARWCGA